VHNRNLKKSTQPTRPGFPEAGKQQPSRRSRFFALAERMHLVAMAQDRPHAQLSPELKSALGKGHLQALSRIVTGETITIEGTCTQGSR